MRMFSRELDERRIGRIYNTLKNAQQTNKLNDIKNVMVDTTPITDYINSLNPNTVHKKFPDPRYSSEIKVTDIKASSDKSKLKSPEIDLLSLLIIFKSFELVKVLLLLNYGTAEDQKLEITESHLKLAMNADRNILELLREKKAPEQYQANSHLRPLFDCIRYHLWDELYNYLFLSEQLTCSALTPISELTPYINHELENISEEVKGQTILSLVCRYGHLPPKLMQSAELSAFSKKVEQDKGKQKDVPSSPNVKEGSSSPNVREELPLNIKELDIKQYYALQVDNVKKLIAIGAKTAQPNTLDGNTPLHCAMLSDNVELISFIHEKNIQAVEMKNKQGKTPIEYASEAFKKEPLYTQMVSQSVSMRSLGVI